jgi:ACS family tartrate transporter-like MFS transporter
MVLGAVGFVIAGAGVSNALALLGLAAVVLGLDAVIGPFWSLPSAFLRGSAAAGGIALINTFGTGAGGFLGSNVIGVLKEQTGGYEASMLVLAAGLVLACFVMLSFGRLGISVRSETRASTR